MKNQKLWVIIFLFVTGVFFCFAGEGRKKMDYKSVSMDEGIELMKKDPYYILLDVRQKDEYDLGHIPGAILHTNELMSEKNTEELLNNKNARIYVYCRSGRRSKEAASKLVQWGYTNIVEIGGILSYYGQIEK